MKLPTSYRSQLGLAADFLLDYDWLYEQYIVLKKSTRSIANMLGCGKKAVSSALKRHRIEINYSVRPTVIANRNNFLRNTPVSAIGKIDDKIWMRHQFIELNRSAKEISIDTGVSMNCVRRWTKKHGLVKTMAQKVQCQNRSYEEEQGFAIGSPEACKKRMRGHRGERLKTTKGGDIWCHSSWERVVALFLDSCDLVVSFSKDSLRIPYVFQEKSRIYYPDFLIKTTTAILVVEVKAERLLNDERVQAKLAALDDYCNNFGFVSVVLSGKTKIEPKLLLNYM